MTPLAPAPASQHPPAGLLPSMALRLWRAVTLLLVALLAGVALAHVLESPAKLQYDADFYLALQQSLYVQWGPPNLGGVLEPLAILAAVLLTVFMRRHPCERWFCLAAAVALLVAFPLVFYVWVAPANAAFLAAAPGQIPADWLQWRSDWETGHAIRFGLQFSALTALALSTALAGPPGQPVSQVSTVPGAAAAASRRHRSPKGHTRYQRQRLE